LIQFCGSTNQADFCSLKPGFANVYSAEGAMSRAGPRNILIVEDEAIQAMSLHDKLVDLGYGIPAAVGSGEQAVQAAGKYHPDLVLMDIKLSGRMDGVEAARQIRELFEIPVVFMSAYSDIDTLQRALLTCSAGYLVKPVLLENLSKVIEKALQQ
jgi:CheY-like chemotaxis protein